MQTHLRFFQDVRKRICGLCPECEGSRSQSRVPILLPASGVVPSRPSHAHLPLRFSGMFPVLHLLVIKSQTTQYGSASNSSRPGGPQQQLRLLVEGTTASPANNLNTTFHLIADSSTIKALIPKLTSDCTGTGKLQTPLSTPTFYTGTSLSDPQPEQAVLYFRGSTVVLTNDGFNNTAALNDTQPEGNETVYKPTDAAAPLYTCLQSSIAKNVPLIQNIPNPSSASAAFAATPSTIVLLWTLFMFFLSTS